MEKRKFVDTTNLNINIIFIKLRAIIKYDYFKFIIQYTIKSKNNACINRVVNTFFVNSFLHTFFCMQTKEKREKDRMKTKQLFSNKNG